MKRQLYKGERFFLGEIVRVGLPTEIWKHILVALLNNARQRDKRFGTDPDLTAKDSYRESHPAMKLHLLTWHAPLLCEPTRRWQFWWRTLDHQEWGFHLRIRQRIFCVLWGHYGKTC